MRQHGNDDKHKKSIEKYILDNYPESEQKLEQCVYKAKYNMSERKRDELIALFNTSYWIVLEGLAFQTFASLCKLQIKNKLTVGENYQNIMGCRMFVKAISETILTDVQIEIKDARFLSFLSDGSTDSSQKSKK